LGNRFQSLNNSQLQTDTQDVRSKDSRPALVGRRSNRLGYVAAMRERQPRGQLAGRLLWGLAVEGHHRSRHAGLPGQLGAPAIAHRRHFDVVRTPTNGFFEMFNDHLSGGPTECVEVRRLSSDRLDSVRSAGDFTPSSPPIKRREPRRRRPHQWFGSIVGGSRQRKMCVSRLPTRFSRVIHRFSTVGPGKVCLDPADRLECRMRMTAR